MMMETETDTEVGPIERERLTAIYEQMMWLARQRFVTPGSARAWYTHLMSEPIKRRIRKFTGLVSIKAAARAVPVRLEHFGRIHRSLTRLIETHLEQPRLGAADFVRDVVDWEQVNIVTFQENYAVRKAEGDYAAANVRLMRWDDLDAERRLVLGKSRLRGRVANAAEFRPGLARRAPG